MISVEASERFRACLRKRGLDRDEVVAAMNAAAASWGRPHLHSGTGIRRLQRAIFECRCGRHVRLVFSREGETLRFDFAGNHDEVQACLMNRGWCSDPLETFHPISGGSPPRERRDGTRRKLSPVPALTSRATPPATIR